MNSQNFNTVKTCIRTCKDMAAIMLHQLGYWPQESFVVVALAGHNIGPCVRIDLPGPEDNTAAYLHRIFSLLPATIDGAQPIDRFIAFYCTVDRDNYVHAKLPAEPEHCPAPQNVSVMPQ